MAWFDWNIFKKKKESQKEIDAWESFRDAAFSHDEQKKSKNPFSDIYQQQVNVPFETFVISPNVTTSPAKVPAPHIIGNSDMTNNPFTEVEIGNINYLKSYFENTYKNMVNDILPISDFNTSRIDRHIIISGGVFSNLFHNQKEEGDVDFFVYDCSKINHNDFEMKLYEQGWKKTEIAPQYKVLPYIIDTYKHNNEKANLIITNHITPKEVVAEFDFVHCTPYYKLYDSKLCLTKKAYDAIVNKWLILQHSEKAAQQNYYQRINKWKERGYNFKTEV